MTVASIPVPSSSLSGQAEVGDPFLFRRLRTWWLILALILVTAGTGSFGEQISRGRLFAKNKLFAQQPDLNLLLVTIVTWTLCLALMSGFFTRIFRTITTQLAILAFPVLAILSTLWSPYPSVTFRRGLLLLFACALGWFLTVAYSPIDQIRVFLAVGTLTALASILTALFLPRVGLDFDGSWKGVFSQKNSLGLLLFFLFSGLVFFRVRSNRILIISLLQGLLAIGVIALSRSKESLVCIAIVVGVRIAGPFITRRRREELPFVLCAAGLGTLALVLGYNFLLLLLNRDPSLSGRTREWAILIQYVFRHYWLGYGYEAFWNGSTDSLQVAHFMRAEIHGADNGYLDTMLSFGVLGLATWVILLFVSTRNIARALRTSSLPLTGYWYIALIVATFAYGFVGSMTIASGSFAMVALTMACASLRNLNCPVEQETLQV